MKKLLGSAMDFRLRQSFLRFLAVYISRTRAGRLQFQRRFTNWVAGRPEASGGLFFLFPAKGRGGAAQPPYKHLYLAKGIPAAKFVSAGCQTSFVPLLGIPFWSTDARRPAGIVQAFVPALRVAQ